MNKVACLLLSTLTAYLTGCATSTRFYSIPEESNRDLRKVVLMDEEIGFFKTAKTELGVSGVWGDDTAKITIYAKNHDVEPADLLVEEIKAEGATRRDAKRQVRHALYVYPPDVYWNMQKRNLDRLGKVQAITVKGQASMLREASDPESTPEPSRNGNELYSIVNSATQKLNVLFATNDAMHSLDALDRETMPSNTLYEIRLNHALPNKTLAQYDMLSGDILIKCKRNRSQRLYITIPFGDDVYEVVLERP